MLRINGDYLTAHAVLGCTINQDQEQQRICVDTVYVLVGIREDGGDATDDGLRIELPLWCNHTTAAL